MISYSIYVIPFWNLPFRIPGLIQLDKSRIKYNIKEYGKRRGDRLIIVSILVRYGSKGCKLHVYDTLFNNYLDKFLKFFITKFVIKKY